MLRVDRRITAPPQQREQIAESIVDILRLRHDQGQVRPVHDDAAGSAHLIPCCRADDAMDQFDQAVEIGAVVLVDRRGLGGPHAAGDGEFTRQAAEGREERVDLVLDLFGRGADEIERGLKKARVPGPPTSSQDDGWMVLRTASRTWG